MIFHSYVKLPEGIPPTSINMAVGFASLTLADFGVLNGTDL